MLPLILVCVLLAYVLEQNTYSHVKKLHIIQIPFERKTKPRSVSLIIDPLEQ